EIWQTLTTWTAEGRRFAVARVLATWGSSPCRPGSALLVDAEGQVAGAVSAGCVEAAVIEEAIEIAKGAPAKALNFGVADETAWSVGLSCGGTLSVFVESGSNWPPLEVGRPRLLLTRIRPAPPTHAILQPGESVPSNIAAATVPPDLPSVITRCFDARRCEVYETDAEAWFLHYLPRSDRLVLVGAGQIAEQLVALAQELGFETLVIDPRRVFADTQRFAVQPDHLLAQWPQQALEDIELHADTYAVVLTHDPKIDDPALHGLLRTDIRYIGALGSRRTHEKRRTRLMAAGFSKTEIDRIRGPVGLDLGAESPAEIALSILAEIVATKRGRDGKR
ncbi:MAG: XdhC/CoxI family protein, partial [Planctomycetota bacterium]